MTWSGANQERQSGPMTSSAVPAIGAGSGAACRPGPEGSSRTLTRRWTRRRALRAWKAAPCPARQPRALATADGHLRRRPRSRSAGGLAPSCASDLVTHSSTKQVRVDSARIAPTNDQRKAGRCPRDRPADERSRRRNARRRLPANLPRSAWSRRGCTGGCASCHRRLDVEWLSADDPS